MKIGYRGLRNLTLGKTFFPFEKPYNAENCRMRFFNFHCCKVSKLVYRKCKKRTERIETKKGNSLRMYGPGYRGGLSKR